MLKEVTTYLQVPLLHWKLGCTADHTQIYYVIMLSLKWIVHSFVSDDILQDFQKDVGSRFGVKCKCPGGGRIEHHSDKKFLKVYGYSQVSIKKIKFTDYVTIPSSFNVKNRELR